MGKKRYSEEAVLSFIENYIRENGYAPSVRDITITVNPLSRLKLLGIGM